MKKIAALIALGGIAGSALAQGQVTQIQYKVRPFGSTGAWSDTLTLQSANLVDAIEVEVGAFFFRNTGYGMSTSVFSIYGSPYSAANGDVATILDDNPTSTLHPDGRVGNFNFGGQFQVVYHTGTAGTDANRFRIAATGNAGDAAAGGVSVKQNTPVALGTNFDTSDGVLGYHFKLSLACYNAGAPRTVTINTDTTKVSSFTVYSSSSSATATNIKTSLSATAPATINVSWAPAPASLGLLGMGALVAGRRRR